MDDDFEEKGWDGGEAMDEEVSELVYNLLFLSPVLLSPKVAKRL